MTEIAPKTAKIGNDFVAVFAKVFRGFQYPQSSMTQRLIRK